MSLYERRADSPRGFLSSSLIEAACGQKYASMLPVSKTVLFLCALSGGVAGYPATDVGMDEPLSGAIFKELLYTTGLTNRAVGGSCGPVTGANVQGVCLNRDTTCCNGFYTVGFCPHDPANILCCTSAQRCNDNSGFCNDVDHVSCSVPYVHDKCPGPFAVQCCRGDNGATFCTPGGPG